MRGAKRFKEGMIKSYRRVSGKIRLVLFSLLAIGFPAVQLYGEAQAMPYNNQEEAGGAQQELRGQGALEGLAQPSLLSRTQKISLGAVGILVASTAAFLAIRYRKQQAEEEKAHLAAQQESKSTEKESTSSKEPAKSEGEDGEHKSEPAPVEPTQPSNALFSMARFGLNQLRWFGESWSARW